MASVKNDRHHKETEREVITEGQHVQCKGAIFHYIPHIQKLGSHVVSPVLSTSLMRLL